MSDTNNPNLADTYSLKGFVSVGAFVDNVRYEVAPLGELSLRSATYAKDRAVYSTASTGGSPTSLELSVFSTRTPEEDYFETPVPYQNLLTSMMRWCHAQAVNGNFSNNAEQCRQLLMAEFDGKIRDAIVGLMISQDGIWLPASLTFYINPDGLGVVWDPAIRAELDRSRVKMWFADSAFSSEYDEFDLEFLSPIDNARLDDFFLLADQVEIKVRARTLEQTHILIEQLKDGKPETKIRTLNFLYHDPNDKDWTLPTDWSFVIYGIAGDNIDSMKGELAEWILENSTHTREEWAVIFPDIFTSTEVIITPMFSNIAIPNETLQDGVYSPTVNALGAISTARRTCTGTAYTNEHIDSVLSVLATPYKSLALLAVGGPENRNGQDRFEEIFPDYLSVVTSSPDFNRMQPETQRWVTMLQNMLKVAETMTDFSDLPQTPFPMTRLRRKNADGETYMYVVANYNNIQYLVVSRQSMQTYFPPRGVDALRITSNGAEGVTNMPNADISKGKYRTKFVGIGGVQPYRFELVSVSDTNKLEGGLLDPDTGDFSADPLAAGDIKVTAKITDDAGTVSSQTFNLHIYTSPQT